MNAFLKGERIDSFVDLSEDDYSWLKLKAELEERLDEIKERIRQQVSLPKLPYLPLGDLNVEELFPGASEDQLNKIAAWMNGEGNTVEAPYCLSNYANGRIFLRLHVTSGGKRWIYNSNGQKMSDVSFIRIFNEICLPHWSNKSAHTRQSTYGQNRVTVYDDRVEIGCQRQHSRAEVERIAKSLGLIKISADA